MAKKKKAGKKPGKATSPGDAGNGETPTEAGAAPEAAGPALVGSGEEANVVTLHFKLRDWHFLDFSLRLPVDTPLFKVKDELVLRHGNLEELSMFKGVMAEENEMQDEMRTLEGYGIQGAPPDAEDGAEVFIYYDFVPERVDDSLLSC